VDSAHDEKRGFPRIPAECPILYKSGEGNKWLLGKLLDLSATGFSMICPQELEQDGILSFQVKPGGNKLVPRISGHFEVVRSVENSNTEYVVSCKVLKINLEPQ